MFKKIGVPILQKTFPEIPSEKNTYYIDIGSCSQILTQTYPFYSKSQVIDYPKRRKNNEPPVSIIDIVLEHLNKRQKVTTSSLDSVEILMLSYAKTLKIFSLVSFTGCDRTLQFYILKMKIKLS